MKAKREQRYRYACSSSTAVTDAGIIHGIESYI
jgi:hypothetical protein